MSSETGNPRPARKTLRSPVLAAAIGVSLMLLLTAWAASPGAYLAEAGDSGPKARDEPGYPGGPAVATQWWLDEVVNTGETTPPEVTGGSARLAIIAPGMDRNHPALRRVRIQGVQSAGISRDLEGTAAAGIAAATGNDKGFRFLGVWPGMNLIHVPAGESCVEASRAVRKAARQDSSVIVMGYEFESGTCPAHLSATQYAVHKGAILVAASGDSDSTEMPRPAADPHVLSVGSISRDLALSPFSNTGPGIDLVAPGDSVLAPSLEDSGSATPSFGYAERSGTRYSATIVGAAAAWILQEHSQLEASQVRAVLSTGARDLGVPGRDDLFGFGLLNIDGALGATAPTADRYEPNDDIGWVNGGLLTNGRKKIKAKPIWPSRGKKLVKFQATLSGDDPADVYRVRIPGRSKVDIAVDQPEGDVAVEVRKGVSQTIASPRGRLRFSDREPGRDAEGLRVRNSARGFRLVYLVVKPSKRTGSSDARYRVRIGGSLTR